MIQGWAQNIPKLIVAAFAAFWLLMGQAVADDQTRAPGFDQGDILLSADRLVYDDGNKAVTALGKVEISDGERILLADEVTYDTDQGTVEAKGNVNLLEPSGDVIFADSMKLDDGFKQGFIKHVKVLFADNSRLAGSLANKTDGEKTLYKAVYSPCPVCKTDPEKPLVWQMKAAKVIHDEKNQEIIYRHARLEVLGVPIAYTPYFSHPDPTVKKKSGFLFPTFQQSTTLGTSVQAPYYWVIDQSQDLTLTPMFYSEQGEILRGTHRKLFLNGETDTDLSLAHVNSRSDPEQKTIRGHLFAKGDFNLNEYWRTGYDVNVTSDKTYLDKFNIDSRDVLRSKAFVEAFDDRGYFTTKTYYFQGLRETDDSDTIPMVLPQFEYNTVSNPDKYGNRFDFTVSGASLTREVGADSSRVSMKGGWRLPYISEGGHVIDLSATLQGDLYHVNDVADDPGKPNQDGFTGRFFPQTAASWRYPMVRRDGNISKLIEPIAQVVISPNGSNKSIIPNEDSLAFELDETNLFSPNRFPGYDRVSSGKRVDYGIKTGIFDDTGRSISMFVGQSYSDRKNQDAFSVGSGLDEKSSDYVGKIEINPNRHIDLNYRFRASPDDLALRRSELGFGISNDKKWGFSGNYIFVDSSAANGEFEDREEISTTAYLQLAENWFLDGTIVQDLSSDSDIGTTHAIGGLTYTDECINVTLGFDRDFTRNFEDEPSATVFLRFNLKNLGTVSTTSNNAVRPYTF